MNADLFPRCSLDSVFSITVIKPTFETAASFHSSHSTLLSFCLVQLPISLTCLQYFLAETLTGPNTSFSRLTRKHHQSRYLCECWACSGAYLALLASQNTMRYPTMEKTHAGDCGDKWHLPDREGDKDLPLRIKLTLNSFLWPCPAYSRASFLAEAALDGKGIDNSLDEYGCNSHCAKYCLCFPCTFIAMSFVPLPVGLPRRPCRC
jgi:hypothetical protein